MPTSAAVNEHYLDHVVALSESSDIEASEDIVSSNGTKLLGKGARIDARVRERLLAHKLKQPLESQLRVVGGVATRDIDGIAGRLLERHPLLSRFCGSAAARQLGAAMRNLRLSPQVESLLTVYAAQSPEKLDHAVGVALLGATLWMDLPAAGIELDALLIAGLMHDVGELYLDPALLSPRAGLSAEQWKHIATHPIVGAHVLRELPGAGPKVAQAVLYHHERLDGFGYPHGVQGEAFPLAGQLVAASEMLMGLVGGDGAHADRAAVAVKLVPGEFAPALRDRVTAAARESRAEEAGAPAPRADLAQLILRLQTVAGALEDLRRARERLLPELPHFGPGMRKLAERAMERSQRISAAFTSAGLDATPAEHLPELLEAMGEAAQDEITAVLGEIEWRLRETQRAVIARAEQFSATDGQAVRTFVDIAGGDLSAAPP